MGPAEANAKLNLIVRGSDLGKSMSSYLVERVQANSRIQVRLHSELRTVTGADSLDQRSAPRPRTRSLLGRLRALTASSS
jgi:thioredoxin reductase (NADPH)